MQTEHSVRIAVTGASGVLGRGLVARLLSQGHEVAGIARRRPESWPSSGEFVAADIRDADAVRRAVTGADVVVHCAWAARRGRRPGQHRRDREPARRDGRDRRQAHRFRVVGACLRRGDRLADRA